MSKCFVRARRWLLKGGSRSDSSERNEFASSLGFEIVQAVRINGEPHQKFIVYLGSFRDEPHRNLVGFWVRAMRSMRARGFDRQQRSDLAQQMVRKNARLPTKAQCDLFEEPARRQHFEGPLDELREIIQRNRDAR